MKDSVKWI